MAKKPTVGLPDVFARPGGAPARGTPIDSLPPTAGGLPAPGNTPPQASPVTPALPQAPAKPIAPPPDFSRAPPAADRPSAPDHVTDPAPIPIMAPAPIPAMAPAPMPATPPVPTVAPPLESAPADPPLAAPRIVETPTPAPPPPPSRLAPPRPFYVRTKTIAWAALAISVAAVLWESAVFSPTGLGTPGFLAAKRDTAALAQQDAKLTTLERQLVVTTAQLELMRGTVATATQNAAAATREARRLAMLRLADLLHDSRPFAGELATLRAMADENIRLKPTLAGLEPYATIGVPTVDQLHRDLHALYASLMRTARPQSIWTKIGRWTGFGGGASASRLDPVIAAAQTGVGLLGAGDLAGAIQAIRQIDGPYQPAFADWVADARTREAANLILSQIGQMTQGSGPGLSGPGGSGPGVSGPGARTP